jgi:hypothetical protein
MKYGKPPVPVGSGISMVVELTVMKVDVGGIRVPVPVPVPMPVPVGMPVPVPVGMPVMVMVITVLVGGIKVPVPVPVGHKIVLVGISVPVGEVGRTLEDSSVVDGAVGTMLDEGTSVPVGAVGETLDEGRLDGTEDVMLEVGISMLVGTLGILVGVVIVDKVEGRLKVNELGMLGILVRVGQPPNVAPANFGSCGAAESAPGAVMSTRVERSTRDCILARVMKRKKVLRS